MKTLIAACLGFVAAYATVSFETKIDFDKVNCPVSGAKVKEAQSADYKDGKVYFCCGNCAKKFDGDKKAYASKANHQLVATSQVEQKACPYSGGEIKSETSIEFKGAKIAFCCNNCKGKAEKLSDDDKYKDLFGDDAFEKAKFAKAEKKK